MMLRVSLPNIGNRSLSVGVFQVLSSIEHLKNHPKATAIAKPTLCTTCMHVVHSVGFAIAVAFGWFYLIFNCCVL